MAENKKAERITLYTPKEMRIKLDAYAFFFKKSRGQVINEGLEAFFEAKRGNGELPSEFDTFVMRALEKQGG